MFTGIIEASGYVEDVVESSSDSIQLKIRQPQVLVDVSHGDSIAVDGICLTVVDFDDDCFSADVMGETLRHSTCGSLKPGDIVNLERSLALGERLGGHLVSGHVDGVGQLVSRESSEAWEVFRFTIPSELSRLVAHKGSVTVNGVSLTVSNVSELDADQQWFEVSLIPTTLKDTNLGDLSSGDEVNLEVDVISRYLDRQSQGNQL